MLGLGFDVQRRRRSPPFDPLMLFGAGDAGAYYDPSDLVSMFQDSAGTEPAAIGLPVGLIRDKSGRGNHASQTVAAATPILRQDEGGRLYLEFDGVDDFLVHALSMSGDVTLSAAAERAGGEPLQGLFSVTAAGTRLRAGVWAVAATSQWGTYAGGSWRGSGADLATRSVASNVAVAGADQQSLFTNGRAGPELAGSYGGDGHNRLVIGREHNALSGRCFSGRLYSLLGIGRALTSAELGQLVGYQAAKAGIVL